MNRRTIAWQYLGAGLVFLFPAFLLMQYQRDVRGTLIVFFIVIPLAFSAFGNFAMPLRAGEEMTLPRLNTAAVILFDLAAILALLGVAHASQAGFNIVMALDFASILLGGASFLATIVRLCKDARSWLQLPLYIYTLLFTTIALGIATILLEIAAIIQIIRHFAGMPIVHQGNVVVPEHYPNHHFAFHFFWFLGHPEVYVLGFLIVGALAEGVRRIAARR